MGVSREDSCGKSIPMMSDEQQEKGLRIRGVSKYYRYRGGQTEALSDINLDVDTGEFICLIGESGCGKSTLLQMIAGFETPSEGVIAVNGQPVSGPSQNRGMVFQEASLLPWLTVEQNISLGLKINHQNEARREAVRNLIAIMELGGFERRYPSQLSGGMAQRVAIARAIVNSPDVLLLDEPFGALDAFTRLKLQSELVTLWQKEQYTTVFVTHDIEEAVFLATRIVVLTPRPGRIARIFNVHLRRPRDRSNPEFMRLRVMIAGEFMSLRNEEE